MYLNCHSYYSLRYGTLSLEKLVQLAIRENITQFALTDINNTGGVIDFIKLCKENGIKPIVGIDFRKNGKQLYVMIAKNNEGFYHINQFLSECNLAKSNFPLQAKNIAEAYTIYPLSNLPDKLNKNEYIGIKVSEINKLFVLLKKYPIHKFVVLQSITFIDTEGFFIHKNLRAIDNNILITQLTQNHLASPEDCYIPSVIIEQKFASFYPIVQNTRQILAQCSIDFNFQEPKNKKFYLSNIYEDMQLLKQLATEGFNYRYKSSNNFAKERLLKELDIIEKLGFASYFLIAWDIVRFSLSKGFYHVGRGSGANSLVAYCLKITDVDPLELDLYFERFINPRRTSPPDFDIDYSWKERDEVFAYIFKRFGNKHTALLGAMSTFKDKSTYRELGKVYGLPKNEIDDLVANPENRDNYDEIVMKVINIRQKILDFPNIRSIHAGGVLISEKPICYYTALDLPPKDFPTTHFDMYSAEDFGFEKLDILSQRGIGHIRECVEIIRKNKGVNIDIHNIEACKSDSKVRNQLKNAETIGCFYIESPAMRGLLSKLRCDNYISLVAASSIIRPGVAKSGMMKEYIRRFHNPDGFQYIHPVMKEQLEETYGVMVYQEDVLKVCHHFAGLDLADADVLRRAMSGKSRAKKEFERIVSKFFDNCKSFGYPDYITNEVWRQIESFAGYSFSKAHSASYAVESFQSLYLKSHFPLEFMVAVINNFGGFYRTWVYVNEAKRWGGIIELPCVNNSEYHTIIIGNQIFLGFVHLNNLEAKTAHTIVAERKANGNFSDLFDFIDRTHCQLEAMLILIKIGAFRFTSKPKAVLLWEAHMYINKKPCLESSLSLFPSKKRQFTLPALTRLPLEDAYDELELLGFTVSLSYFELADVKNLPAFCAKDLAQSENKYVTIVGHLVTIKYVKTIKNDWMHFGTFLDINGQFFDTVHFAESSHKYPFCGEGLYAIKGTVIKEFGYPSIHVDKMLKIPLKKDPRNE